MVPGEIEDRSRAKRKAGLELDEATWGQLVESARSCDVPAKVVDAARLAISPQCGFASTMGGNPVTEADERAKLSLCVDAARAIWG